MAGLLRRPKNCEMNGPLVNAVGGISDIERKAVTVRGEGAWTRASFNGLAGMHATMDGLSREDEMTGD
jgi:hypothetical protein